MGLKDNCGVVGEKGKEETIPPLWGPLEILACIYVDLMGTKRRSSQQRQTERPGPDFTLGFPGRAL